MRNAIDIVDLGVEEVAAGLADGSILLVDVREPNELAHGTIPGSLTMPLSRFEPAALPVADGRELVFSCAAGVRSRIAIELAREAGVEARAHLAPGFKGWVAAGGTVNREPFR
jgi:rhodanese-related sulfurtransferase